MSSRTATSTVTGMRAVRTISCRAECASVIHAGTASGCAPARVSPAGCKTKQGSTCTSYRRAIWNRSPARGWKRYRITTSVWRICRVVCRPLVSLDQAAPTDQVFLRYLGECGEVPDLDRRVGLRARCHRQEAAQPVAQPLRNPTDSELEPVRENPTEYSTYARASAVRSGPKRQPADSLQLMLGQACRSIIHDNCASGAGRSMMTRSTTTSASGSDAPHRAARGFPTSSCSPRVPRARSAHRPACAGADRR